MQIKCNASTSFRVSLLLTPIWIVLLASSAQAQPPEGWIMAGDKPGDYDSGVTTEVVKTGKTAAFLKSKDGVEEIDGFGTMMQQISPERYLGERVRFSGYAKSEGVSLWAGLWMRVDHAGKKGFSAFDNMQDRPIKGTSEWNFYEIVLDVAEDSGNVAYGFLLSGTGTLWVDGLSIEIVGKDVPVTNATTSPKPTSPINLDFEK